MAAVRLTDAPNLVDVLQHALAVVAAAGGVVTVALVAKHLNQVRLRFASLLAA
jgi:uncharacterized membrane protein YoaK (UPF0700 family)